MLFDRRSSDGIANGTITATFRRWRRTQAIQGHRYRTPGGIIEVESVELIDPSAITDPEASRAGYRSSAALIEDLHGEPGTPVFHVRFHRVDEPDPRTLLANESALSPEAIDSVTLRLTRLDARSGHGPWTASTLASIAARPGVRAADLAADLGREVVPFKRNVRSLKELGLTFSLEVGYRLSPRGEAYLRAIGVLDRHGSPHDA